MKNKKSILVFIYTFLLLYHPPILQINIVHILALIALIYLYVNRHEITKIKQKGYKFFLVINSLFFCFSTLLNIYNGNYINIYSIFLFVLELQICVFFLNFYTKKNDINLIEICIFSGIIQAIIAILSFFIPFLQTQIINLFIFNGYPEETVWFTGKRFFGFASQLTFTMPILQMVLAILLIDTFFEKKESINFCKIFGSLLLVFSAIINARTSIVVLLLGLLYLAYKYRRMILLKHYVYFFITVGLMSILIFIISPITFNWIFDGIREILLLVSGQKKDGYFEALFESFIFFPSNVKGLLIGEGVNVFNTSVNGLRSDVGYIIDIWNYGLIGMILRYCGTIFGLIKNNKTMRFPLFLLSVVLICNIKGIIFELNEIMVFISIYICIGDNEK